MYANIWLFGRIINVSSLAGRIGFPLSSAYVSSKFALEGLVESLRYEVQPFGIHVSLIEPGVIKTNFVNNMKIGNHVAYFHYEWKYFMGGKTCRMRLRARITDLTKHVYRLEKADGLD